ncbi:hypothetical protein [Mesorhizobium sp. M0276]|uniref:hypothetical protein n=1 Tax=Mesorhizobium sp. M0276 TaxID=2956928 RepID=UPI00333B1C4E
MRIFERADIGAQLGWAGSIGGLRGLPLLRQLLPLGWSSGQTLVTNLDSGSAEHFYDVISCARGQAESLIKMHKSQLTSWL